MYKPKFLLSASFRASGTTSLYYTLWSNKYGHGGRVKENQYLEFLQSPHLYQSLEKLHKNKIKFGEGALRPWLVPEKIFMDYDSPLFPYTNQEFKLEKYIAYYLDLWERIKGEYQSVLDFSNTSQPLSEKFMLSIKDELLKHFDLKFIMILRDPISRLWAHCNRVSACEGNTPQNLMKKFYKDPNLVSYRDQYRRYANVWGEEKIKIIINEDFYLGKTQNISDFLEYDIKTSFYQISHLSSIKDKVYNDWCKIDIKTWENAFQNMSWVYEEYEKEFGYIPHQWGRHSIL